MSTFYFESLFNTAVTNIDAGGVISGVVSAGNWILLAALLFSIYENWHAQDADALGRAGVRYFVAGALLAVYTPAFLTVNHAFNLVAQGIDNAGAGGIDVFVKWSNDLGNYIANTGHPSLWGMVTGTISGAVSAICLGLAYLIFPISTGIFAVLYCLYGSILFALGPIVLGLLPLRGLGQLGKTYAINLMIFNTWGIIYAVFGSLLTVLNLGTASQVMNSGSFLGSFVGVGNSVLLGLVSILLSIMILTIPIIATKIVKGDVGSAVGSAMRTVSAAAGAFGKFGGGGGGGSGGGGS
jgi:hypothetical protein